MNLIDIPILIVATLAYMAMYVAAFVAVDVWLEKRAHRQRVRVREEETP